MSEGQPIPARARAREDAAYVTGELAPDDPLYQLQERVAKGIAWLTEHDPSGGFYFMVKAGLTRLSPMPSRTEQEREDWIRWYDNYRRFEQLFAQMQREERKREMA